MGRGDVRYRIPITSNKRGFLPLCVLVLFDSAAVFILPSLDPKQIFFFLSILQHLLIVFPRVCMVMVLFSDSHMKKKYNQQYIKVTIYGILGEWLT